MGVEVVQIVRRADRELVDARLIDEVSSEQLVAAESRWKFLRYQAVLDLLRAGTPRGQIPEHWHWDWTEKVRNAGTIGIRIFGIECETEWQGLMMTTTIGHLARLAPDVGERLVYVKYIESAPWNVKSMSAEPRFSVVGPRLIEAALRQSLDEGYGGRVGLHSLPSAQLFYDRCGFVNLGLDAAVEDLPYYELTNAAAVKFLQGGKR